MIDSDIDKIIHTVYIVSPEGGPPLMKRVIFPSELRDLKKVPADKCKWTAVSTMRYYYDTGCGDRIFMLSLRAGDHDYCPACGRKRS